MDVLAISLEHDGPVTRVICSGVLSGSTVVEFNKAIDMALETDPKELRLDASRLMSVSKGGAVALVRAAREASECEASFVVETNPIIEEMMDVAGLASESSAYVAARSQERSK